METETFPRNGSTAALQTYLHDINATPLLSGEDERILARRVRAGDPTARDHLVRANLRLVVTIARGYLGRRLCMEDLIAEGNLGLMRAVEGFDPDREIRFSTYASYWIKQSMRRAVINQGQMIRLPAYLVSLMAKWARATAALSEGLGRVPTSAEVGKALGFSRKRLRIVTQAIQVKTLMRSPETLNGNEGEDGLDHLLEGRRRDGLARLVEPDDLVRLLQGLDQLDDRRATVIRMRFGLDRCPPMTLTTVGAKFGLTRERIRQLEKEAIQQLRDLAGLEQPSDSHPTRNEFV